MFPWTKIGIIHNKHEMFILYHVTDHKMKQDYKLNRLIISY